MTTTTVSTKGQVILPKAIRGRLRWEAGTRLEVEETEGGVLLRPAVSDFPPTRPEDVFGCLSDAGRARSVEEMDAAIAAEVARRHAHGRY